MVNGRPWTEHEEAWLGQIWPNLEISPEAIAHALKRTTSSVQCKVRKLGIGRHKWKEYETQWLTDNYGRVPSRVIAYELHRTEEAIHHKARKLGLDGTGQLSHAGKNNPAWKGGYRNEGGYIVQSINGQRILEHRLVVQKHLGRELIPEEVVHHINRIPDDNRIENLQLVTRREHNHIHGRS